MVLLPAENHYLYRPRETGGVLCMAGRELDIHRMRIVLVFVHDQQRPLAVGPQYGIRRNQRMARAVVDIATRGIHEVLVITRLQPLQVDELTDKELRQRLPRLQIGAGREEIECPR